MKTWIDNGSVLNCDGEGVPKTHPLYQEILAAVAAGEAQIVPYVAPVPALADQLAPTDKFMARAAEDLIVALIQNGTMSKGALDPQLIQRINARRAIRGQPVI